MLLRKILPFFFLLFPLIAKAQLTSQGKEQQITYSGTTASIAFNTPAPNFLVTTGVNTFIMSVNPNNVARVYLSNETVNACANITVSIGSTAQANATSFNNAPQVWQTVPVLNASGTLVNSTPVSIPASGTATVTSSTILGNRIAIFIVLSSGCATTNIDVTVIFGTTSQGGNQVQGLVPAGQAASGTNPFLMAGKDNAGNVRVASVLDHTVGGSTNDGVSIGGFDASNGAQFLTFRTPAGGGDGPLAVSDMFLTPNGANLTQPRSVTGPNSGACFNGNSCAALVVADTGYDASVTLNVIGVGTNSIGLWQSNNFPVNNIANSKFESCQFVAKATNTGGTSPTLDVYIQDSGDNSVWDDRIHFGQFAATAVQIAGIAGTSANETIHIPQDAALAASTIVSGPIGMIGRVKTVAGGTGPTYTLVIEMSCK